MRRYVEDGISISNYLMEPAPAAAIDSAIKAAEAERLSGGGGTTKHVDGRHSSGAMDVATFVPEENKILAALGIKTLLKMLIDDNFLHADLHPGNILVRLPGGMRGGVPVDKHVSGGGGSGGESAEGGGKGASDGGAGGGSRRKLPVPARPEIVILDTGLATELTPHHQASLAEFFQAIISWDGPGVANKIISFSSNISPTLDMEAFKRDVAAAVTKFSESTPRAGDCMTAIFKTVQEHHVTIDPNVMVAVVTVMVLEGWQFRLDPSVNILDYISEVLRSSIRKQQRLTIVDFALRDMWAPFSEPNELRLDRSGRSPLALALEADAGHDGEWAP